MLGCILALQLWRQYLIRKYFDVLTDHAPNQYILSQQKLLRRQVRWVKILADYAANFIYKPDRIHSAADALSCIPAFNTIRNTDILYEAIRRAQSTSSDQEFLYFCRLAHGPKSHFQLHSGLVMKDGTENLLLVIPADASQLKQNVLSELHASPLGGDLGYLKFLALVNIRFGWLHFNQSVQEFCHQCVLC